MNVGSPHVVRYPDFLLRESPLSIQTAGKLLDLAHSHINPILDKATLSRFGEIVIPCGGRTLESPQKTRQIRSLRTTLESDAPRFFLGGEEEKKISDQKGIFCAKVHLDKDLLPHIALLGIERNGFWVVATTTLEKKDTGYYVIRECQYEYLSSGEGMAARISGEYGSHSCHQILRLLKHLGNYTEAEGAKKEALSRGLFRATDHIRFYESVLANIVRTQEVMQ